MTQLLKAAIEDQFQGFQQNPEEKHYSFPKSIILLNCNCCFGLSLFYYLLAKIRKQSSKIV
jgi:hypothetical protein